MSKSVVSFTKQTGHATPYWLLQQLAGIDAILVFSFSDQIAHIGYNIPNERVPRDDYLCRLFNAAPEDFKQQYVAVIWDLIGLPRNGWGTANVSEIRFPLWPIFWDDLTNGATAGECLNFVRKELDEIPSIVEFASPLHIDRIVYEAIRDRIFYTDQEQSANWRAAFDCARAY